MKSVIIIPTYNERDNIERIVDEVLRLNLNIFIIIVDDNSPDRTGMLADTLAEQYDKINVIHRRRKVGLGAAYVDGFKCALSRGAEKIITMDADFSHDPKDVPRLLKASENYDVVVGSRYTKGGQTIYWGRWRKFLSWGAVSFSRILLGLKIKDCTAGFRCYNRRFLESLNLDEVSSKGHAFQVEMIFYAQQAGFSITEIPITFQGRKSGESKVDFRVIFRFAQELFRLAWDFRFRRSQKFNL